MSAQRGALSGPEAVPELVAAQLKPRARGWIHQYATSVAGIAGAVLVAVSWLSSGRAAGLATLVYTAATVAMFVVSAAYHRVQWGSPATRAWMKRLDHSMIFVFIAGTYTPFALAAMPAASGKTMSAIVWCGAAAGCAVKLFWPSAPRPLGVALYLVLGWVAIWFYPAIIDGAGVAAVVLLLAGGAIYSAGAVFYATRWPDPWPATFGYHEFFHACTAVAAVCHYVAVWLAVL